MEIPSIMIVVACFLVITIKISKAEDSITVLQSMSDGMTLVSKGGMFELGFFSPGSSQNRYLGIWYKNIPIHSVVWVANRVNPTNDSTGILKLNSTGNLVLTQNGSVVWSTNSQEQAKNPVVELLDSGNLVIRNKGDTNPEKYLWQSFDYPSDTFIPGMKLGWNLRTGLEWKLTAWSSPDDPSQGDFYSTLKLHSYPEFYIMKGKKKLYRFGPWNGLYFSGVPNLQMNNTMLSYYYVSNTDEIFFTYKYNIHTNSFVIARSVANQTSNTYYHYGWAVKSQNWNLCYSFPKDLCDTYSLCGPYGSCAIRTQFQACQCLKGFSPKSQEAWNALDWSLGCVRNRPLTCKDKLTDGFVKFTRMKVPDTTHTWLDESIGIQECRVKCLNNCSCMAYANSDISGEGSGCVMWFGDLIDLTQFQNGGQDLYIRMTASELALRRNKKHISVIVASAFAAICGVLLLISYFICRIQRNKNAENDNRKNDDIDLPTFDFSSISNATNHFSESNKLGQGGFGPVYKGILPDGQEIAVKRLSKTSTQGLDELKNEVMLIAKLQHRNLVKLLGCSIEQDDEKLLIYEFLPNRSLDCFIFDSRRRTLLGWVKRFEIIGGIARGLLYLHQDSRLKIIHRDLKTSNILLDNNMNPKISDFGMARTFGLDQDESNTNRVMGTYGYMPPEYAVHGSFSVKSDVFSFGVIMLEIISGMKIREFCDPHHQLNLLGHAWRLWIEKRPMGFIDDIVEDSVAQSEIIRYIHIGLLCVQQRPEDRPTMLSVVLMLNSEKLLPEPTQPGFYTGNDNPTTTDSSPSKFEEFSLNEMSSSMLEAR